VSFFDFESAERREREIQPLEGRGDTVRALLDHRWVGFAVLAALIALVGQIPQVMALVAFMTVVILAAWLWSRASLRGLIYARRFPFRRFFPGEELEVEITVENRKRLPLPWLQAEDAWPLEIPPIAGADLTRREDDPEAGYLINTYSLRGAERIRRRFRLRAERRGVYRIGPAELLSGDPFSLFDRKLRLETRHDLLIVYPRMHSLADYGLPLKDPFGDKRVQQRLFEDPNRSMGIRDYAPTDSFRHVHWKATARTGELKTRIYEPTRSLRTVLCLNVATFEQHWRGVWPAMLEYEMELAASLAAWALGDGHSVGLVANGTLAHADQPFRLLPSRRPDQLTRILQVLAAVSYYVSASFDRFLLEESPRIPWGATLVVLTPTLSDAIGATLLRLRDSGRRIVVIVLGKEAGPRVPGVLTYHLPIAEDEPPPPEEPIQPQAAAPTLTPRQRYLHRRAAQAQERAADEG